MLMYWPRHKVALDIKDDPRHEPFERDGWTVVHTSEEVIRDLTRYQRVMRGVAALIGSSAPEGPAWDEKSQRIYEALCAESA